MENRTLRSNHCTLNPKTIYYSTGLRPASEISGVYTKIQVPRQQYQSHKSCIHQGFVSNMGHLVHEETFPNPNLATEKALRKPWLSNGHLGAPSPTWEGVTHFLRGILQKPYCTHERPMRCACRRSTGRLERNRHLTWRNVWFRVILQ